MRATDGDIRRACEAGPVLSVAGAPGASVDSEASASVRTRGFWRDFSFDAGDFLVQLAGRRSDCLRASKQAHGEASTRQQAVVGMALCNELHADRQAAWAQPDR